jgi:large subunit ribosomal protein L29
VVILVLANDIRKMDTTKINDEIVELKKELFDLRFKQATGQLENTARISRVKKTIARMKTILNERA